MNPRKLLRIARWEVTKNAGGVDRRTIVVGALALLAVGIATPYAATSGVAVDSGIYRVGITNESAYYDVVREDPTFAVRDPQADLGEEIELRIDRLAIDAAPTPKAAAAQTELRSSVRAYNNRQMRQESNQSAAFPVRVSLGYTERTQVREVISTGDGQDQTADDEGTGDGTDGGDGDGSGGGDEGGTGTDDGSGTDGNGNDGTAGGGGGENIDDVAGGTGGVGGIAGQLAGGNTSGTPADISPPFPFQSLVLAFLFVLPLNFIIQAYGSTMVSERLNRRGELLLVAPVSRFDIIGGKTLPYLTGAIGIAAVIAAALELPAVDPVSVGISVLAVTPIALLFLGATFLGAMFARSFKELTFVTVTVTVSLTTYAFVPAIFTDVGAVALISPLTIVVRNLQGQAIGLGEFAFSLVPPLLTAGVFFGLGAGIYREEDMFTQRSIPLKALDALAARVHGKWSVAAVTAILLPFVFVTELVGVAALFAIPDALSIPTMLVVVVVVEEFAKSLHVYAGYAHDRFEAGLWPAVVVGAFSGIGFFLGEKIMLLAQLVGLPSEVVEGLIATGTATGVPSIPIAIGFLLAPLALHVVTAAISAVGASRNRRAYLAAVVVAMAIHFAYNYTVVSIGGF
ncbi:ABC-type transport system permease protein [Halorientalis persicus]|uniref:ABC-type transport system permease protein n=1 Tax=Halorientalis persicus TaxID=1367881 RepID=A0A1H8JER4_9EURY|nr:PrsW family intramembrane metalloprotease [Halorientalis persicus]SEN79192.1 ABC-type transport system permease protein [Halorientalis persicus]